MWRNARGNSNHFNPAAVSLVNSAFPSPTPLRPNPQNVTRPRLYTHSSRTGPAPQPHSTRRSRRSSSAVSSEGSDRTRIVPNDVAVTRMRLVHRGNVEEEMSEGIAGGRHGTGQQRGLCDREQQTPLPVRIPENRREAMQCKAD
eukprot:GHVU01056216.1.p1 GENE.GHVU01056216.1~~GHVU01056216.1.p1  ORF type:complete len:144 (-),score=10.67 GHVU01056216.1:133-564(-)